MRLFIAAQFPGEVLGDLNAHVARFRSRLPHASWVRPEAQHLTFAFLGDQPQSLVSRLETPLTSTVGAIPRFDASLRGSGFFPNPRHARVGWVGLEPESPFQQVAGAVRDVVTAVGVALDKSDFKAHLTLMRIRESWPPSSIVLFSRSMRDWQSAPFIVDNVTLFSSQLHPKGAIHTPLHTFALGST